MDILLIFQSTSLGVTSTDADVFSSGISRRTTHVRRGKGDADAAAKRPAHSQIKRRLAFGIGIEQTENSGQQQVRFILTQHHHALLLCCRVLPSDVARGYYYMALSMCEMGSTSSQNLFFSFSWEE